MKKDVDSESSDTSGGDLGYLSLFLLPSHVVEENPPDLTFTIS